MASFRLVFTFLLLFLYSLLSFRCSLFSRSLSYVGIIFNTRDASMCGVGEGSFIGVCKH